jgi:hypothetical protein
MQDLIVMNGVLLEEAGLIINCERKTDESFVNQLDKAHHKGISLLVNIKNFELITGCALDYMHMAYLGVMRKLLNFWINSSIIFTKN